MDRTSAWSALPGKRARTVRRRLKERKVWGNETTLEFADRCSRTFLSIQCRCRTRRLVPCLGSRPLRPACAAPPNTTPNNVTRCPVPTRTAAAAAPPARSRTLSWSAPTTTWVTTPSAPTSRTAHLGSPTLAQFFLPAVPHRVTCDFRSTARRASLAALRSIFGRPGELRRRAHASLPFRSGPCLRSVEQAHVAVILPVVVTLVGWTHSNRSENDGKRGCGHCRAR